MSENYVFLTLFYIDEIGPSSAVNPLISETREMHQQIHINMNTYKFTMNVEIFWLFPLPVLIVRLRRRSDSRSAKRFRIRNTHY